MVELNSISSGRAIPFITVTVDESTQSAEFSISPEAMTFLGKCGRRELDSIEGNATRRLSVMVLNGPANTGKSFLANQIIGHNGFKVRDGMPDSPGTQGIWLWNQLIPVGSDLDLLVMDCQGISDDGLPEVDLKLLALSMLLSSQFVFNTIGLISDDSLNLLSIM
jgi:hypothetical protein